MQKRNVTMKPQMFAAKTMNRVYKLIDPRRNKCDVLICTEHPPWSPAPLFKGSIRWGGPSGCRIETPLEVSVVDTLECMAKHMGWPYKRSERGIEVSYETTN